MLTVIPFECKEIGTCLDGFTNPPSYAQCVSLGPTREDSIRLDFSKQISGNDKVFITLQVFAYTDFCLLVMRDCTYCAGPQYLA